MFYSKSVSDARPSCYVLNGGRLSSVTATLQMASQSINQSINQ